MVVNEVKQAMARQYGEVDDDAIVKITGAADKPQQLIRRFRNEVLPNIAVTVDLLTTGIDVPPICNLVFIRRVNSRILYEQMLGRATRRCDDIGKQLFRVFDAVDLYRLMNNHSTMKPVVVNPNLSIEKLAAELTKVDDPAAQKHIKDQIVAKIRRVKRHIPEAATNQIAATVGVEMDGVANHLNGLSSEQVAALFANHEGLAGWFDHRGDGGPSTVAVSHHDDELRRVERGYGDANRPEDYLDGFKAFLEENINAIPALKVITQRPRDLTRKELKELRLLLDAKGYSEANLQTAWRDAKNRDIAASIIGFIRQAALGDPLEPYELRVQRAMTSILTSRSWTKPQQQWLKRIGEQLIEETIVDRDSLDREPFRGHGGVSRLSRIFDGNLENIVLEMNSKIWNTGDQ